MSDWAARLGMQQWLFFALLSAVFAAATTIFGKIGVQEINSNMATWIRVIVIFAVTSGIIAMRSEWVPPATIPNRTWLFLVLSGIATGLSWLCYYRALQVGQASQIGPIDKLSVVLVMLMGVLILGERLSLKQWGGGVLILAGVLCIAWPGPQPTAAEPMHAHTAPSGSKE